MSEKWFSMETIRRIHPLHVVAFFRYVCIEMNEKYNTKLDGACSFHSKNTELLFNKKHFDNTAKKVMKIIIKNPELIEKENKKLIKEADHWTKLAKKLLKVKNWNKVSKKQLANLAEQHIKAYKKSHGTAGGHLLQMAEFENELCTKFIQSIIEKKIKRYNLNESLGEAFTLVSSPEKLTSIQKQEIELMDLYLNLIKAPKLTELFRKNSVKEIELKLSNFPSFSKKLNQHHEKWLWLPFMYEGPVWDKKYFIELLSSMTKQYLVRDEIELKKKEPLRLIKKKKDFLKKLPLNKKEKKYFKIFSDSVFLKAYRKDAMYFACFASEKMLAEIGKRLYLSLNQIRYFTPEELKSAILEGKYSSSELNKRIDFCVITWLNEKEEILSGKKARTFFNKVFKLMKTKKVSKLQGTTAVPGNAKGKIKVINHPNEIFKMNQGDVLVSHSTNPNLVPAMKKASAIVTDLGGITCHAAIVSRELNIPCVIGTKIATHVLKDNDLVEVDATHGILKKVKK